MKLIKWRKKENKSRKEVAEAMGVDVSTICDWERGKKIPRAPKMRKLSSYTNYEVMANDFFYGEANESN